MGNILIVDDDAQLRQSFEKILTAEGHTVKTASSGEAAISLVKAVVPDLVIMDVRMPGMSGLEAFRTHSRHRAQAARDHHDRVRDHRYRHRGHQDGGFRIRPQALRHSGHHGVDRPGPGSRAFHAVPGGAGRWPGHGRPRRPSSARANPCRRSTRPSVGWPPPTPPC